MYLSQVAQSSIKGAPYNETHFDHPTFTQLVKAAVRETDVDRRRRLCEDAQVIEHEEGGFLIWSFQNQVDAYSTSITGVEPAREQPMSAFRFNLFRPAETR